EPPDLGVGRSEEPLDPARRRPGPQPPLDLLGPPTGVTGDDQSDAGVDEVERVEQQVVALARLDGADGEDVVAARRARERRTPAVRDEVDGRSVRRDYARALDYYTMGGRIRSVKDVAQYLINTTQGLPKMSF
ncbi:MAG TPA: hypothetical protein PKA95_14640, partial [Thermomicrobiales bacterium]|nr:hypothetical protein [Thermomicrobiales bacterium]